MPFLPDAWLPPLHHIYHDLNEYCAYKLGDETVKVLRCSREKGRAEKTLPHPNGRVSHWSADVTFGDDGFVWMSDWTTEQILTSDGAVWKTKYHPSTQPLSKIGFVGIWFGQQ